MTTSDFELLVQQLKQLLCVDTTLGFDDIEVKKLSQLLGCYVSNEDDWAKYALHDPAKNYSRNGVEEMGKNANLLILVWEPQKGSAIHDHASAHCIMKILKGSLVESLYEIPADSGSCAGELKPIAQKTMRQNDVGYIADSIGLHRMYNPTDEIAVSLHLYTPPYAYVNGCSYYETKTGAKHHISMSNFYSWRGELCD